MTPMMRWITAGIAAFVPRARRVRDDQRLLPGRRRREGRRPHHRGHLGTGKGPEARGQRAVLARSLRGRRPRRRARFRDPGGARPGRHRHLEPGDPCAHRVHEGPRGPARSVLQLGRGRPDRGRPARGPRRERRRPRRPQRAAQAGRRRQRRPQLALPRDRRPRTATREWEADIRSTFAERWIANARAGWYYKSKAGAWTRK